MSDAARSHVAVCALTYLRPTGLARLLDGLAALEVPDSVTLTVVIVDNDPAASARAVVDGRSCHGAPVVYVHEPARGISQARNAGVAAALQRGADAVCFIDDDEWPEPNWLREMLETCAVTGADIVTGPVLPVFESEPPKWIVTGAFFERRRHEHHERIRYATTSSVLISSKCFVDRPQPFDHAFGLSGGEDTHLFAELREAGFTIVWCDRARVHETIPASRVNARWLLNREYRRGQTLSLSMRRRTPGAVRVIRRIGNASVQMLTGVASTVLGIRTGRAGVLRGVRKVWFGAGMLTGLAGRRYQEYGATTHGT